MTEHERYQLGLFVETSLQMARQIVPFARALVEQPDREDLVPHVIEPCFRLVRFIIGKAAELGLELLAEPAAAMEYLLDRIRSGILVLTPRRIGLVAETCTFLEQGLVLIAAEQSDHRLAHSATSLALAIRSATDEEAVDRGVYDAVAPLSMELQEAFFWETDQLLRTVEQECVLWDFIAINLERVAELSRVVRRLKQHFALFGFREPERVCQALEATLRRYAEGEFFQTEYPERVFLRCIDALRAAVAAYTPVLGITVADVEHHLAALQGMMRQPIGELLVEAGLVDSDTVLRALAAQHASSEERIPRLGEVLVAMGEVTQEEVERVLRQQHEKRARTAEAENVLANRCGHGPEDRLTFGLHEVLIDGRRLRRMGAVIEQLTTLTMPSEHRTLVVELQALLRACDRDALASLARRLQRVAHDMAVRSDRRVHCTIEGLELLHETEDVSGLADALVRLVENSAEHGLESVADRRLAGKRTTGRIDVLVFRHGEEIWSSVEDDGRGMEGILDGPRTELADNEFSGSGRSPGLVAVQTVVAALGGDMHLANRPGKGTCITLRVPRRV